MILFLHVIDQGILAETNACGQQFVLYTYIYMNIETLQSITFGNKRQIHT